MSKFSENEEFMYDNEVFVDYTLVDTGSYPTSIDELFFADSGACPFVTVDDHFQAMNALFNERVVRGYEDEVTFESLDTILNVDTCS